MSWKCDICDSYNEEGSRQCYVCGQPRSAESIREGKIREREERIADINASIYKNVYGVSKIVFIFGLNASLVVVAIAVILKIANGQLDDIWQSAFAVIRRFGYNLDYSFSRNPQLLFDHVLSKPFKSLAANTQVVWLVAGNNFSAFLNIAFEIIPMIAKKNIISSYNNGIVPMSQNISSNIAMLGAVFSGIFSSAAESISRLINVATGMFSRAIKHFD